MKNLSPFLLTAILLLPFAAGPGWAFAQNPGSLDLSFDPGVGANSLVYATAIQSDGKIVIGGTFSFYNGTPRNCIARLNEDGSLDASFAPDAGVNDDAHTIAIQSDGRILIGGLLTTYNGNIARLNADGTLDATFDPGAGADWGVGVTAIQGNGRIVIGGLFSSYNGTPRNRIARLNEDGTLDTTFDPGTGAVGGIYPDISGMAIQGDERIIIGGNFTSYNGTPRNRIARLNPDGTLDATFVPDAGLGGTNAAIYAMAIQSDGRIVIGGQFTSYNGTPRNCIARLNVDGSLDATFDPGAGAAGGTPSYLSAIAIQSDGRIVIGGLFNSYNGTPRNSIARVNSDGSLDVTFEPGAGADNTLWSATFQNDGRIIIGGNFTSYNGTSRNRIARLDCEGTVGIEDIASTEFSIFPNPASSSVSVVMPEQLGRTELVLRNSLGQEVLRSTVTIGPNEVPLSGLAPGVYAVQVNSPSLREAGSAVQRTQCLVIE